MDNNEITGISGLMKGLDRPCLSLDSKIRMKSRIMAKISTTPQKQSFDVLRGVQGVASGVWLTDYQKLCMRERILSYIETAKQKKFMFGGALSLSKRLVGAFLVFAMVMGLFSYAGGNLNVASADSFTVIEDLRGEVVVERDGDNFFAYNDMELEEGDTVYTGEGGWVSIRFLDDSVARLKEGSLIKLSKLFENSDKGAVTNVEVEVSYGDMWARVLNLFEDGDSFIVKAGGVEATAKKAAFNVHMDDDSAVIEVYSNVVEMKTSSSEGVKVKKGQKAEVKTEEETLVVADAGEVDEEWVQSNLESDKVHIAKVEEQVGEDLKNTVGSLPESNMYPFKSIKTGVVRLLTFDDISKQKFDFEVAQRQFVEWSVMMQQGEAEQDDAEEVFDRYVVEVDNLRGMIANIRANGDEEYADELKAYLDNEIKKTKKSLKSVLPTSPLYTAKEYMNIAEQASAESEAEKTLMKKKQIASKLAEVQDLSEVGEEELAQEMMEDYTEVSEEMDEEIKTLLEEEAQGVESEIAEVERDEQDMITAIADDVSLVEEEAPVVTTSPVVVPVLQPQQQQTADFGVPTVDTGDGVKILDPLLDLSR